MQQSSVSRIIMQAITTVSELLPPNVIGLADIIERARIDKVKRWGNARAEGLSVVAAAKAVGEPAGNLYQ